ncbi:MAG: nucleotidyltransferase family protein [Syntrophales bacterium]
MLEKIDAIILCGGKGQRLGSVGEGRPKALINVAGRPFIDILMDDLLRYGLKRFILSVGYLREQIKSHFSKTDLLVEFSEEDVPLGTGGAIEKAAAYTRSSSFLVLNGDSICRADLLKFFNFHIEKNGIVSMVLAKPLPGEDYGIVEMDESQRITRFAEKTKSGPASLVNAGIYFMKKDILSRMPGRDAFSLEHELFPKIVHLGCYGFPTESPLIDIGTPERLERANLLLAQKSS